MSKQQVLVVGGLGFVGGAVCRAALSRGLEVTTLSMHAPAKAHDGVSCLTGDIADREAIRQLMSGRMFAYVVNCGGYIDHRSYFAGGDAVFQTHFGGVRNLVDAVDRKCLRCFVQIGSSDEYGDAPAPQSEASREDPISPYALAKVASAHFLKMLWHTDRYPAVTLRLFLAYGPGQDRKRFLPQIIQGCLSQNSFPVSAGGQLRDFCFVEDIAEGILRACEVPSVCGQVVNLASGAPVTIRSMIARVRDLVGQGDPVFGQVPYRAGENMALWADTTLARELLGWSPRVSLEEGLSRTVEYYRRLTGAV